ncbi:condensation domain-containing protein [Actinomadura keratinilytica]
MDLPPPAPRRLERLPAADRRPGHLRRGPLGRAPVPPRGRRPFREYAAWLARQDTGAAVRHWRQALDGFTAPTPLPWDRKPSDRRQSSSTGRLGRALPAPVTALLTRTAREHRLTLNTLVQGAWALLLSRYAAQDDVCFGSTRSIRPRSCRAPRPSSAC